MSLGSFIFTLQTATFQNKKESRTYRWNELAVIGDFPVYQYMGPGEQNISLEGVIYTEHGYDEERGLPAMRKVADSGEPLTLVDGAGNVYGKWVIVKLDESHSAFKADGTPKKISFSLQIKKVDERPTEQQGTPQIQDMV
jgi:phage protein U